jgi:hypothetical protein
MNTLARTLIFVAALLAGCRATRDVAVTSYHVTRDVAVGSYRVASAPVHYALGRNRDESSTATRTEASSSDVAGPNQYTRPPEGSSVSQQQPRSESAEVQSSSPNAASRVTRKEITQAKPKPSPSSHASASQGSFPTAKSVPGKPGYVFSPFDSTGRYVDISGYAPGTKVKDPWTDKIFIVP